MDPITTTGGEGPEPIAIIGTGCRLPGGVKSASDLWELLKNPRDLVMDISSARTARFNSKGFFHPDGNRDGASNASQCYLCEDDIRVFDNEFFGIHAREVESMDPQQRILMEVIYEAIETSGLSIHSLQGSQTGVFVGQMTDDYRDLVYRDIDGAIPKYTATGVSRAITANRVSYFFDWNGPSMNIDTACSSSLVALHQAVQSLRTGECSLAVAAGVNLILGPELFIIESNLRMLSPSGRCRMWDEKADGYGRGDGVVAVVLKTLRQAILDNDDIECVVRNTGMNQDGRTIGGLTVPSATSQAALIRSTYAKCGLDPMKATDRCQFFEAHGTGTAAGDPKEAEAIRRVFFQQNPNKMAIGSRQSSEPLYVGSVKTIMGHSEGAAGLVGVLKASLAVQHGVIPPNLHFNKLSPALEPFYTPCLEVPTVPKSWPQLTESDGSIDTAIPRRVSVNSFGFGGTNAHAILEAWTRQNSIPLPGLDCPNKLDAQQAHAGMSDPNTPFQSVFIFPLSAKSKPALARGLSALSRAVSGSSGFDDWGRLAATLQSRRTEFPFRTAITARTKQELIVKLDATSEEIRGSTVDVATPASRKLRILGVFTGQGAQWPRMGASLFSQSPVFRNTINRLEASLACLPNPPAWSLSDEMLAGNSQSRVEKAEISQPLTTALQIALVDLLRASGTTLDAVVGHSSGEVAAAYASGHITGPDAIRIAYYRGLYSSLAKSPFNSHPGGMIAVKMPPQNALNLCKDLSMKGRLTIAAINGPSSVTIAGDMDAINEIKSLLDERETYARVLKVDKGYHSHHMEPCAVPYLESLKQCAIQVNHTPSCNWYSSVYGNSIRDVFTQAQLPDPTILSAAYWVENLTRPVLFQAAVERAAAEQDQAFDLIVEIGPHSALQSPVMDTLGAIAGELPSYLGTPYLGLMRRGQDDVVPFFDVIGRIWSTPSDVDWNAFRNAFYDLHEADKLLKPVKGLPSYSWDHEEILFFESCKSKSWRSASWSPHPLLGRATQIGDGKQNKSGTITMTWRNIIRLRDIPWLRGHKFQNQVIIPASGYISMATDAVSFLSNAYLMEKPNKIEPSLAPVANLVELEDMEFHRAVTLRDEDDSVELLWVVRALGESRNQQAQTIVFAEYSCYSGPAISTQNRDRDSQVHDTLQGSPSTTTLNFGGKGSITLSSPEQTVISEAVPRLPSRVGIDLPLISLNPDRFYSWLSSLGLHYSQDFILKTISRRRNMATVAIEFASLFDHGTTKTPPGAPFVHPAALDGAFQGLFAAYCFPGDGRMQDPFLPVSLHRIRIDMARHMGNCHHGPEEADAGSLLADCYIKEEENQQDESMLGIIRGDVDLFCTYCGYPTIQVEDLKVSRLNTKDAGRLELGLFARTTWESDFQMCGFQSEDQYLQPAPRDDKTLLMHTVDPKPRMAREDRRAFSEAIDRVAFFQLKELCRQVPAPNELTFSAEGSHLKYLLDWAHQTVSSVKSGQHPRLRAQWLDDRDHTIQQLIAKYHPDHVEMQLVCAVAERLPSFIYESTLPQTSRASQPIFCGNAANTNSDSNLSQQNRRTTILDTLMNEGKLRELYHTGVGFREANNLLGVSVRRLAHRYPTMRILEIGAGSGSATVSVLEHVGDAFDSYTFTDISSAFFADAKDMFNAYSGRYGWSMSQQERVRFAVLDIEDINTGQDGESEFQVGGFDLIIASNVLHATRSLRRTLENCRRLLRPGGWLVINELTTAMLYGPFIVSGLAGWWLGSGPEGDQRGAGGNGPTVSETVWDDLLRQSGFSGIDHLARDTDDEGTYHSSVMVSQAVDARVQLLREPLTLVKLNGFRTSDTEQYCSCIGLVSQQHESSQHLCSRGPLPLPLRIPVAIVGCGSKDDKEVSQLVNGLRALLQPAVDKPILLGHGGLEGFKDSEKMVSDNFIKDSKIATDGEIHQPQIPGTNQSITPGSAVICILSPAETDYSDPSRPLSAAQLAGLRHIFNMATHVLFVTTNLAGADLQAAAILGIGRTVMCESPHLRVHFIQVDSSSKQIFRALKLGVSLVKDNLNKLPDFLAGMFLRMIILDRPEFRDVLWSNETELAVRKGKLFIPRVGSDPFLNKQALPRNPHKDDVPIQLVASGAVSVDLTTGNHGRLQLRGQATRLPTQPRSQLRLDVLCSSFFAFSTIGSDSSDVYICLGRSHDKPRQLFVSASLACCSTALVAHDRVAELAWNPHSGGTSGISEPLTSLRYLVLVLLCESLLHDLVLGTVWLHDSSYEIASIAIRMGQERGIDVFLSTSLSPHGEEDPWDLPIPPVYIHPRISQRQLKLLLPSDVRRLVLFGHGNEFDGRVLANTAIRGGLVSHEEVRTQYQQNTTTRTVPIHLTTAQMWHILDRESSEPTFPTDFRRESIDKDTILATLYPEEIFGLSSEIRLRSHATVVSWRPKAPASHNTCISVEMVQPRDLSASKTTFLPDKTYLLVGLSGQLGMSLIEWMATMGAKHFVLFSRQPDVEAMTQTYLRRRLRIAIHTWPVDVSDMPALNRAYSDMISRPEIPPIGGVANGAMILRDLPFNSMLEQDFEDVMRPKVRGTQNLDRLFHDVTGLDFFILLASSGSLIGNAGQANYNAANLCMAGIAEQRRKRGLASSVIYLGAIGSVGHVARAVEVVDKDPGQISGSMMESQLRRFSNLAMSEQDFHKAFAAAVESGRPGAGMDSSLIVARLGDGSDAPWKSQPRFSLWMAQNAKQRGINKSTAMTTNSSSRHTQTGFSGFGQPLRQELTRALQVSVAEGLDVLQAAFAEKLGVILQTSALKLRQNKTAPFISIGVDSLVAVEVRSWLLKEFAVDVPIFKILGGWSLVETSQEVISQFDPIAMDSVCPWKAEQTAGKIEVSKSSVNTISSATLSEGEQFTMSLRSTGESSTSNTGNISAPTSRPWTPTPEYQRVGDMSPAQARLYFLHQFLEIKSAYNVGYVGKYEGPLDLARLQRALLSVCMTHESLRSCYLLQTTNYSPQNAIQAVLPAPNLVLLCKVFKDKEEVWKEIAAQRTHVFDIERGQLLRVTVMSLGPELHHILFLHHHIAMDGVGWLMFVKDLDNAFSGNQLAPPAQQCIDLSTKQLSQWRTKAGPACTKQDCAGGETEHYKESRHILAFWREMHRDPHDPLPLFPFAKVRSRKVLGKYDTVTVHAEVDARITEQVKQTAARLRVTPFHFYLSALAAFLGCCLEVDDLSIGIVDANRPDIEDGLTMGYFLNMLPLRFRLRCGAEDDRSFAEVVNACKDKVLDVLSSRRAPLEAILDHLGTTRSGSHHPLFQVAFDYRQGYHHEQNFLGGGTMRWDAEHSITAQNPYDIFINITQLLGNDCASLHWTMQRYMYDPEDSRLLVDWYLKLVERLATDPDVSSPVLSSMLASERDLRMALELGKGGTVNELVPTDGHAQNQWECSNTEEDTLIHQVERAAARYPDSIAIIDDIQDNPDYTGRRQENSPQQIECELSYSQLLGRTHQIAQWLELSLQGVTTSIYIGTSRTGSTGFDSSIVVGTVLHPSSDYVCSLLGILRLGWTYVGLDLRNPEERLRLMLSDCKPRILICNNTTEHLARTLSQTTCASGLPTINILILNLDEAGALQVENKTSHISNTTKPPLCSPFKPAVILYTSGSTGTPKGVLLTHRNLYSHIKASSAMFRISHEDVLLQQTSPGFDFCLDQIFHALANAGKLVMVGRHGRGDPSHLAKLIVTRKVTVTVGCPSEYAALLNFGGWGDLLGEGMEKGKGSEVKWRLAFSGGEKLTAHLRAAFERIAGLLNGYGHNGGDESNGTALKLVNVYGPTEVTIACARGYVPPLCPPNGDKTDDKSTLNYSRNRGDFLFPMPGYEIRVLDTNTRHPVPVGFPGEICIAGEGIALGYLNRDEETRAKFICDPQQPPGTTDIAGGATKTYYRSGDYGRLLEDGSLHILGRIETPASAGTGGQVKIRGMRVELDEISNVMLREAGEQLNAVAVSYRGDMGGGYQDLLVAFVVFKATPNADGGDIEVIERLKLRLPLFLPSYMCPSLIISVDQLPINVNGKLDVAAVDRLPLSQPRITTKYEHLEDDNVLGTKSEKEEVGLLAFKFSIQQLMEKVWRDVLGEAGAHHAIDADSDFFLVGGSSMSAIKLRSSIQAAFGGFTISLPDIFRLRTIKSMAACIYASEMGFGQNTRHQQDAQCAKPVQSTIPSVTAQQQAKLRNLPWVAEIDALFEGLLQPSGPTHLSQSYHQSPLNKPEGSDSISLPITLCKYNGSISQAEIFLTGATGLLGTHVLNRLLSSPWVSRVHCLVRRRVLHTTFKEHSARNKIIEYVGDLSHPRLGLSETQFAYLARTVHAIIHNGAEVSFLQPYTALRGTNTLSTRTICAMALERRVPVHFISSAAVAGLLLSHPVPKHETLYHRERKVQPYPTLAPVSVVQSLFHHGNLNAQQSHQQKDGNDEEDNWQEDENTNTVGRGYALSKAVSEALLERVSTELGLPTFVHRAASIVSPIGIPNRTIDKENYDIIGAILKFSRVLQRLPFLVDGNQEEAPYELCRHAGTAFRVKGAFDFVSVEEVSERLVGLVLGSTTIDRTRSLRCDRVGDAGSHVETQFIHHCSNEKIPPGRLREYLAKMEMGLRGSGSAQPSEQMGEGQLDSEGSSIKVMSEMDAGEWLVAAKKEGLHPVLYEYLQEILVSTCVSGSDGREIGGSCTQGVRGVNMPVIVT